MGSEIERPKLDYVTALKVIEEAFATYATNHPKWWKKIAGTPIENDLAVTIALKIARYTNGR